METKVVKPLARRRALLARLARPADEAPLRVFCSGIGGTGLSGLARLAADLGHAVSGSDRRPSPLSESLAARSIEIHYGQRAENLPADTDLFVATAALPPNHPELVEAAQRRIPIVKYAEALASFVAARRGLAVAGTHGKTTTTALLATLLEACDRSPSYIVGGQPRDLPASSRIGDGPDLVFEACEFDRSFRHYQPGVAIVLNVEVDHLDCYGGGLEEIVEAFVQFGGNLRQGGSLVVNGDCTASLRVADRVRHLRPDLRIDTFSVRGAGRVCASNIDEHGGFPAFDLQVGGRNRGRVQLQIPGRHNVANALAAIAAAEHAGAPLLDAAEAVTRYTGVRRRFDVLADGDVTVVGDYAHHPTAIRAVIEATRARFPSRRVVTCFEPHQASRTRELFKEFAAALAEADLVKISDIYLCRDTDHDAESVSAAELASAVRKVDPTTEACHVGDLDNLETEACSGVSPGDVLLFLGAGKIGAVATRVAERVVTRPQHPEGNAAVLGETSGAPTLLLRDRLDSQLRDELGPVLERNVSVAPYCTFKAGGKARFFSAPRTEADAIRVVRTLQRHGVPFVPLGGGSNVLFAGDVYDGAVLLTRRLRSARVLGDTIRADCGASLPGLIRLAERNGLAGLERFAGIPGTLGGAVFGNAGGPPGTPTVAGRVRRVRVLEADGRVVWRSREELGLRYRGSDLDGCLILSVDLELRRGNTERLRRDRMEATERKARTQPLGARSAGCTFRNPKGESAGRLIDKLGLKGMSRGAAEVSTVHGNFIVNRGGATPSDILGLMDEVRAQVFKAHGITLHPELRLIA